MSRVVRMVRLTRAQQQERNRAAVLAAARAEFGDRGYADAKVDRIAERAELTRGAVYSNFPSKRALYLAVLIDSLEEQGDRTGPGLGAFARVWLERLPLTGDTPAGGHLKLRSLSGVFDDEPGRAALAQLAKLEAILLGRALESGGGTRRVRLAELVLTLLAGAADRAEKAPGFGDPFDVIRACEHLADLDLADTWDPPHLPFVQPAHEVREEWTPPAPLPDLLTGRPVEFDGVLTVLGTHRLGAAEEAVRAAGDVTVVVVTSDPAELGRLVRLRTADLAGCLRRVFDPLPGPRIVLDDGSVARALGVRDADDTEAAARVEHGAIAARASGRGAGHAVGTWHRASR
jgi:AcrR family transcriptional regulator